MLHYHGLPITPATAAARVLSGGHGFLSIASAGQLPLLLEVAQSFAVDNGAFSAWKRGSPVGDWQKYYSWVDDVRHYPSFDFAVIPDVIEGSTEENDQLIQAWPWNQSAQWIGAPVWHLDEPLERLERLADNWPRVCIGSAGIYRAVGCMTWWARMAQTMDAICDSSGRPRCKLHGLRMLNPAVFSLLPLASADSTNIARNIGIDSAWRGTYPPAGKEARAAVLRERIEAFQAAVAWRRNIAPVQIQLF